MRHAILSGLWVSILVAVMLVGCSGSSNAPTDGDGQVCNIDEDCQPNEICLGNICTDMGGDTDGCTAHSDCPVGELCINGGCTGGGDDDNPDGDNPDGDTPDGDGEIPIIAKCPEISITPDEINFESVYSGATARRQLQITNDGNSNVDLEISAIQITPTEEGGDVSEFTIVSEHEFPIVLMWGSPVTIEVEYSPANSGIDEAYLSIVSNDCDEVITRVLMYSLYKGTAKAAVDPVSFNFGNVDLGGEPKSQPFTITHTGLEDGNKVLSVTSIVLASGLSPHYRIIEGEINPLMPVRLNPQESHTFVIQYQPQTLADEFDPHVERVLVTTDADEEAQRLLTINLRGTAESTSFSVVPYPIDFGRQVKFEGSICSDYPTCVDDNNCCPTGQTCFDGDECMRQENVSIYNWSGNPLLLIDFDISDLGSGADCSEFSIDELDLELIAGKVCTSDADCVQAMVCEDADGYDQKYCQVRPGASYPVTLKLYYQPTDYNVDDQCKFRVRHNLPGLDEFISFDMIGEGRPPNKAPVARASLQDHGPPIEVDIENLQMDTRLCFYGNISYDLDGQLTAFDWSLPTIPTGSAGNIILRSEAGISGVNCCIDFDVYGDYVVRLMVKDDENTWSNPLDINVNVKGDQWARIVLTFEEGDNFLGSNLVDMDLKVEDPIGISCYDERLNSNFTCSFAPGNGVGIMSRWVHTAGADGHVEEMRITNPADGMWTITAAYQNNCEDWYDFLAIPFCGSRLNNNNFRIEIYDPNNYLDPNPLFPTLTGSLSDSDTMSWRMLREDGIWQQPQAVQ